nr:myosin phosphatase Rho-interacting protein isoform X2 [Vicugna pacos]
MEPPKLGAPDREGTLQSTSKPSQGAPGIKRQRIRFSTIQCQKYTHPEGSEKIWTSSTSSDTSQDRSPSEESMSSEATPGSLPATSDADTYLSIIHSLETKLYVTEEKLKDVTVRLESQQGQSQEALLALHQQWAGTEAGLREQLRASLLQVGALASQLEQERQARARVVEDHVGELGGFQVKNSQALACLESCRERLRSLPGAVPEVEAGAAGAGPLASVESLLVSAIQALGHTQREEEGPAAAPQPPRLPELSEQEQLKLLSDQMALEAALIGQIAESVKRTTSDVAHVLSEVSQSRKVLLDSESGAGWPRAPADAWAKKVLVDGEFWSQVESLREHLEMLGGEAARTSGGGQQSPPPGLGPTLADATWVRAELSFAMHSVREALQRRLQSVQETLQGTQAALQQHKRLLGDILGAYQTPDFERVMQQVSEALEPLAGAGDGVQASWGLSPAQVLSCQDTGGSQELFPLSSQSPGALVAVQEELALQLKDKASLLGEISAALTSLPSAEPLRDCQQLLQASRNLSQDACLGGLSQYSSLLVQDAIVQAQVCYAACRIRLEYEKELRGCRESWPGGGASCQEQELAVGALREEYEELLRKQKSEYLDAIAVIEKENAELKSKVTQLGHQQKCLEEVEGKHLSALQRGHEGEMQCVLEEAEHSSVLSQLHASVRDRQDLERHHVEQMQTLEDRFQLKIKELQTIHQEELRALQEHYSQTLQCLQETLHHYQGQPPAAPPAPGPPSSPHQAPSCSRPTEGEADSVMGLRARIQELEAQATCERGFAAMEETHQKKIEDLQRQHQRELEKLREEKDRLLAEETAATISAIEAMKNAHREELERELEKSQRSRVSSVSSDVEALRRQYLEELQSVQRELEVLSEQYSQKCLENAHLAQALEAERQALRQCQRENQELNAHNQELNNRLAAEISRLRTLLTGDAGSEAAGSPLTQGKDAYELEVLLRVKESEIQYLKQEISSLKDELQTALRDKKYASDKYKDIYTELSIVRAKADCDISRLKEQLKAATEALGDRSPESTPVSGYDIMKSKSNPDFLKKDRSCVSRQLRSIRSKSLKEGLTVQDRLKLFESRDLEQD